MTSSGPASLLFGILVGGRGLRMGGVAKGQLRAPDTNEPLLERTRRLCTQVSPDAGITLVGDASAYTGFGLPVLSDDPPDVGPLGGLRALLAFASRERIASVVALSCDLPYFSDALLLRLIGHAPGAQAVAPRQGGRWQPMFARYASVPALAAAEVALTAGDRALQRVLARLDVSELLLSPEEQALLRDWDEPSDSERP